VLVSDQAHALRLRCSPPVSGDIPDREVAPCGARTIAITGGKGGVGKSNLALNLGLALSQLGRRTVLVDGDITLANLHILLGVTPAFHLGDVMAGRVSWEEALHTGPGGLQLLPGGEALAHVSDENRLRRLLAALSRGLAQNDYLVFDTAAGAGRSVLDVLAAVEEVLLVTVPEPTALADAYQLIKSLWRCSGGRMPQLGVVVNQCDSEGEGRRAFGCLATMAQRFLRVRLSCAGYIPLDPAVSRAVRAQTPFLLERADSPASSAVRLLAHAVEEENGRVEGQGRRFLIDLGRRLKRNGGMGRRGQG